MTFTTINIDTSFQCKNGTNPIQIVSIKAELMLDIRYSEFSQEQFIETITKAISEDLIYDVIFRFGTDNISFDDRQIYDAIKKAIEKAYGQLVVIKACCIKIPHNVIEWDIEKKLDTFFGTTTIPFHLKAVYQSDIEKKLDTLFGTTTIPFHLKAVYQSDCDVAKLKSYCEKQVSKKFNKIFDVTEPFYGTILTDIFKYDTALVLGVTATLSNETLEMVREIRRAVGKQKVDTACTKYVPFFGFLACFIVKMLILDDLKGREARLKMSEVYLYILLGACVYLLGGILAYIVANLMPVDVNVRFMILMFIGILFGPVPFAIAVCK